MTNASLHEHAKTQAPLPFSMASSIEQNTTITSREHLRTHALQIHTHSLSPFSHNNLMNEGIKFEILLYSMVSTRLYPCMCPEHDRAKRLNCAGSSALWCFQASAYSSPSQAPCSLCVFFHHAT